MHYSNYCIIKFIFCNLLLIMLLSSSRSAAKVMSYEIRIIALSSNELEQNLFIDITPWFDIYTLNRQ